MSNFEISTRFTLYDAAYEVVHTGIETIRTANAAGRVQSFERAALETLLESDEIEITHRPTLSGKGIAGELMMLPKAQSEEAVRRLHYARFALSRTKSARSKTILVPLIAQAAERIKDDDPPSPSRVAVWIKAYVESGFEEAVFLSKVRRSRAPANTLDVRIVEVMNRVIGEVYLTNQRNPVRSVMPGLAIALAGLSKKLETSLPTPSIATVRRYVLKIDVYYRDLRRFGALVANRKHRAAGRGFFATQICELWMADGQILDLIIIDADGVPLGRAFATSFLDLKSRVVPATKISLAPFSGATLLAALKKAVAPVGDAPGGIPSNIVVDGGADYRDNGFAHFCASNHTVVEPCEPGEPNQKAVKERYFGTFNRQLIHRLPGTTFSNPKDRGDYESQKFACYQLHEVQNLVDAFLIDYNRSPHEGLGGAAPLQVWNECLAKLAVPVRTMTSEDAEVCCRTVVKGTVSHGRVRAFGLPPYYSAALRAYEIEMRAKRQTPSVEIRVDELDLGVVFVETNDPKFGIARAESSRPQYANRLSLFEHRQIREMDAARNVNFQIEQTRDTTLYRLRMEFRAALAKGGDPVARRELTRLGGLVLEHVGQPKSKPAPALSAPPPVDEQYDDPVVHLPEPVDPPPAPDPTPVVTPQPEAPSIHEVAPVATAGKEEPTAQVADVLFVELADTGDPIVAAQPAPTRKPPPPSSPSVQKGLGFDFRVESYPASSTPRR